MKKIFHLLSMILIVTISLSACDIKESNNIQEQQQETSLPFNDQIEINDYKLTIYNKGDDIILDKGDLLVSFISLFERMWGIAKESDEDIYLPDYPYEIVGPICIFKDNKHLNYDYSNRDAVYFSENIENVIYVILGVDNSYRRLYILENSNLHNELRDLIKLINDLTHD